MAYKKQGAKEHGSIWWRVLSISSILPGVLYFISNMRGNMVEAIISLTISLIFSYFLWKQNILAFKIYRILILFSIFIIVLGAVGNVYEDEDISFFGVIETITILANITTIFSLVALWIQLKRGKHINW